ncbi:MAG: hypothetical protein U0271_21330 [Polyangiaceae bacterium]
MSRLPVIRPSDLRQDIDDRQVGRIWSRVREDLPPSSVEAARPWLAGARATSGVGRASGVRRATLVAAAFAATLAGGVWIGRSLEAPSASVSASSLPTNELDVFAAGSKQRTFSLPRGGKLTLEPDSLVEVVDASDNALTLHLLRGTAAVDTTSADLAVAVLAGETVVSAPAGSSVSLSRGPSDVDVSVSRGVVEVKSPSGPRTLQREDAVAHFPTVRERSSNETAVPSPVTEPLRLDTEPMNPHEPVATTGRTAHPTQTSPLVAPSPTRVDGGPLPETAPSWLALAAHGNYEEAYEEVKQRGGLAVLIDKAQSVRELVLLSEIGSAAGLGDQAIRALRRAADEFSASAEGVSAAFELARIYEASDKTLAAKYREKAKAAAAFLEYALCGELRDLHGDATHETEALEKAVAYLAKYPTGSCADDAQAIIDEARQHPAKTAPSASASSSAAAPATSSSAAPSAAPSSSDSAVPAPSAKAE